jgi:hypothetical protein
MNADKHLDIFTQDTNVSLSLKSCSFCVNQRPIAFSGLIVPISPLKAEEAGNKMETMPATPETEAVKADADGKAGHETMKEEEEHKHDEGMHGMMGHHTTGWIIFMGVIMVAMMVAHIL